MINLFHINSYNINTSNFSSILHDPIVTEFEDIIADYVGAKYAVALNSATNAIFLTFLEKKLTVSIPSVIPPVVPNALLTSGNKIKFYDNIDWVGDSYILHKFKDYKVVDSAQKLERDQFIKECDDNDLMIFSFYPTKPIGSCDGGLIVSNDADKIQYLREMSLNGMSYAENNWDRKIKFVGYKMYMNSIQAKIGLRNFDSYKYKLDKLRDIRSFYNRQLNLNNSSNHLYRITVDDNKKFIDFMKSRGIMCGVHYNTLHTNSVYSKRPKSLPLSEKESITTASIPFHEKLEPSELDYIINNIYEYNQK